MTASPTELPTFLYGAAWKEERTESLVLEAIGAGFRAIDTANQRKHYHEVGVGAALGKAFESGSLSRADLFLHDPTHRHDRQRAHAPRPRGARAHPH